MRIMNGRVRPVFVFWYVFFAAIVLVLGVGVLLEVLGGG